ncbi:MAG: cation-translocating P-type ATPase, partial [Bacillota bacterium]
MDFNSLKNEKYYKKPVKKIIESFQSSEKYGLNKREANKRLRKFGKNKIKNKNKRTIFTIFFEQFKDFMIIILILATIISFFMGELLDTIVIFSIVILNGFMGFIQEYKAEKSLEKLKEMASPLTKVIRDGEIIKEKSEFLVVGDIILLKKGDKVPADGRIIESHNFSIDQSIITGESLSVEKNEKLLYANNVSPADRSNMVFMGSTVVTGKAKIIIVRTAENTEMGKIAKYITENIQSYTPLQKKLKVLGKYLVFFSLLITLVITFIGIIKGNSFYQMILAGISLAVAAIPEGLPAIVTLVLALGVQKMTKKNAVVRKLPAVETLGCTTVICSDKTGTLTKNSMRVKKLYYNNKIRNLKNLNKNAELKKMLAIGAICNGCEIKNKGDKSTFTKIRNIFVNDNKTPNLIGDPTDKALIRVLYKLNFDLDEFSKNTKIIKENEFDSAKRRMSILVKNKNKNKKELWIKGAVETILGKSTYIQINGVKHKLNKNIKEEIISSSEVMANDALRIIAVAYKEINKKVKSNNLEKHEN